MNRSNIFGRLKEIDCIMDSYMLNYLRVIKMKRIVSVIMALSIILGCACISAFAEGEYPIKRNELHVRDPYILTYDGKYYMYGTCLSNGNGYGCSVSENLEDWSKPIQIYTPAEGSDEIADFWAPECHYYEGSFYLFATYRSEKSGKRGTAIFKSSSPLGPFEMITDGHVTPKEIDCIDGTLFIDDDGQPWMVYVNEWTSSPDEVGEMAAAKLSDDLTRFISEPIVLFRARKHIWTTGSVTDGPCLYKTENGRLIMLWSNLDKNSGYAVGMAASDSGKIDGNWIHYPDPFYNRNYKNELDGGHPMLFYTFEGQLMMSIHSPNSYSEELFETAAFYPIEDNGNTVSIKNNSMFDSIINAVYEVYYQAVCLYFKIKEI